MSASAAHNAPAALRQRAAAKAEELKPAVAQIKENGPSTMAAFIKLGRPKFLPYSAILLMLGALFASQQTGQSISWSAYALGLGFVWTSHLGTHYSNEYFDYYADLANETPTKWSGGSRVLVDGHLPTWSALLASIILTAAATLQIWAAGWDSVPVKYISAAIIGLAWSYTSPPFRVHYHSLGEVIVAAVLTTLVPLFGFATQPGVATTWENFSLPTTFLNLIALLALQQWARMVVMSLPDVQGDAKADKITFPVRVGVKAAGLIYAAVQVALVVLACFLIPFPLLAGFLAMSFLGFKTALRVLNATHTGSWVHSEENVDIPFKATMHCAGTAAACATVMLVEVLLGNAQ
ncbi:hypothetical protein HDU86_004638 [Geranomyces michiganensis]|nr:hypothetical protein HDU86_004638 [Geranomyces michiganensis]